MATSICGDTTTYRRRSAVSVGAGDRREDQLGRGLLLQPHPPPTAAGRGVLERDGVPVGRQRQREPETPARVRGGDEVDQTGGAVQDDGDAWIPLVSGMVCAQRKLTARGVHAPAAVHTWSAAAQISSGRRARP
jgi:hypothetical protein